MYLAIYNNSLNDTLLVVSNLNTNNIKTISKKDFSYGLNDKNEIVFINIFNFSRYLHLHDGCYKLNHVIVNTIQKITLLDLSKYQDMNLFVIGKILECEDISNTHLRKCQVNIGEKIIQIICGASNARVGLIVVVALDGAILPNGKVIRCGKILSFPSQGMICSKKELNIKDSKFNDSGIIELDDSFKVGNQFDLHFSN